MNRIHRRAPLVAAAAALLASTLVVALPAGAGPAPVPVAAPAALAPTEDRSAGLPRTSHHEVVGDFRNRGYDQRMVAEGGNLVIYDPKGGAPISTPTDLQTEGGDFEYRAWFGPWRDELRGKVNVVSLAWTPDALFMAGRTAAGENLLYRLRPDGSCAQRSCATWVTTLPGYDERADCLTCAGGWVVTTTSLAVGRIDDSEVLAVGLSTTRNAHDSRDAYIRGEESRPGGVWLVDPSTGSMLDTFSEGLPSSGALTMVTALDWDDNGSGLLGIGVADGQSVHAVRVSGDQFRDHTAWVVPNPTSFPYPVATSVAIGHRPDESPVIAYGYSDGSVKLWEPSVTSTTLLAQATGVGGAVDAVTFTDRIDDVVGLPDLVAVSSVGNSAQVLRFSGATTLAPLPVAPRGGVTTDVGGIRAWFPGYKTGRVRFSNDTPTDQQIQLDFATRPNAAYGCWFAHGFDGLPALPTTTVSLGLQARYSVAAYTAGESGDCAATDFTGQWAAYVVATPLGQPADRTVAKLVWSRGGELTVQSVGGRLKLVPIRDTTDVTHPLGSWTISFQSVPPPGVPTSLKVTGKRLDPAGTDRPVYRFDVPASSWPLQTSTPPRAQTTLLPLRVSGVTTGGDTVTLGLLVPQGQPSRPTGGTVTLSPVSFYWQNPLVGPQIVSVGVSAGGSPLASVTLADLPAPPVSTTVGALVVCPATGSTTCDADADPVANGLDQAPLRIQARDVNDQNQTLPLTDPAYGQIYYRDQDDNLLTGLIPTDGSDYVRVSPYAGAYPNDGSSGSTTRPPVNGPVGGRFGYLSTTSTVEQDITAHVGGSSDVSDPITVHATTLTPQVQPGGEAGQGFYLTGCAGDYTNSSVCRIAASGGTAPGLFLTTYPITGDLRIGLQLQTQAQTSLTSLPLQQVAGQFEHTVAASPLLVNNGEVHLNTTNGFQPADTVDTWLVTHGEQIPIRALRVGGGN